MVVFKVFSNPESLDSVASALKEIKEGSFRDLKREPIGFGIEVIRVGYVIPDKTDGALPILEEAIRKIPGINEVEVDMMTLL
jgi:translation elongation factor EF-1beta